MSILAEPHGEQLVGQQVPPARTGWAQPESHLATAAEDAAFSAFFRSQFGAVSRTVHLIVRDRARAEDIAQEAFLQLYRYWDRVAGYERPEAWVRRVAIRLAMRSLRRDALWAKVRALLLPRHHIHEPEPDVPAAVARLPRAQRAAIVLHYYEDRPVAEIAAMIGCSEPTARVHLHRGRRRLAELLGEGHRERA
jgi:RNA polymerase sigma-70 factor (ECF subfamily)